MSKKFKLRSTKEKISNNIQLSLHAVSQFYNGNKQLSLFSDEKINEFTNNTGLNLLQKPDSYGAVLNLTEQKVFEGIINALSRTNYSGNEQISPIDNLSGDMQTGSKKTKDILNTIYKNVDYIPVIKITQADLIKISGFNSKKQKHKQDVTQAINTLATKQFCFYWLRTKYEGGKILKDKNGDYLKEEVMEIAPFFRVNFVRKITGEFDYYEIRPSAVVLDQAKQYFLLIPENWRSEVKQITGNKASRYTYQFLVWLRYQFAQINRYNKSHKLKPKKFVIKKSWEEIAIILKMPETMYKRNRKKANSIIQEAYKTALELKYLVKIEDGGGIDIFYLNTEYYALPGELV
jgi:hypothetical protein